MDQIIEGLKDRLKTSEKVLIGIGGEWKYREDVDIAGSYESLYRLIGDKDYFIVTTVTDGKIFDSPFDAGLITAPCGNERWRQCSKTCTKDIWEEDEIPDDTCPHCGAPLTGNTIMADLYIENGYLPQWEKYTSWLSGTLHKKLLVLELGESFQTPTVIRWPFEKTVYLNKQAYLYRINKTYFQISEEIKDKMTAVPENSLNYICNI